MGWIALEGFSGEKFDRNVNQLKLLKICSGIMYI